MIEANEDISLVAERQLRDVEQGQAQAKAIAEGREMHPADIAAQNAAPPVDVPPAQAQILVKPSAKPPTDPDAALRHLRLSIVAIIVLVLFFFWIRQKKP